MIRAFLLSTILFFACGKSQLRAQGLDPETAKTLRIMEDSLLATADSIYNEPIPDFRKEHCERFVRQLIRTLKIENSYAYPFDSLQKLINVVQAPDKTFRIFNWPVAVTDVSIRYYAAIQMNSPQLKLSPLFDNSDLLKPINAAVETGPEEWTGGLIYNILARQVDGEQMYFLLTANSGNPLSNKKIIEPLRFTANGIRLGAQVFATNQDNGKPPFRFVLEYKKEAAVSMNWDAEYNAIIYDELASEVNDPNRKYTFIPTGQYNGLRWGNDKWFVAQNLIPVMELMDGAAPEAGK